MSWRDVHCPTCGRDWATQEARGEHQCVCGCVFAWEGDKVTTLQAGSANGEEFYAGCRRYPTTLAVEVG